MAAKLIPALVDSDVSKACKNGEWEELVFNNVAVPGLDTTSIDYELNFAKAGLGMALWVEYTGTGDLTINALWSTRGGSIFLPYVDGPSVTISSSAVVRICSPTTPDFHLTLSSTGSGTVTAILTGTCGCCGGGGC